jgi:hypothetical protein
MIRPSRRLGKTTQDRHRRPCYKNLLFLAKYHLDLPAVGKIFLSRTFLHVPQLQTASKQERFHG